MIERLGKWYILHLNSIICKIHQKHIDDNIINIKYDYNQQKIVNINDIKDVAFYNPTAFITIQTSDDFISVVEAKDKKILYLHNDEYEDLVEMENMRKQIDKLVAHVQTLMITSGGLPKDYDGEFP